MVGLYDTTTRRLLSVGTAPAVVPEGMAIAPLPEGAVYGVTHVWQEQPPAWVTAPTPEVTQMTAGDFMRRLGFEREVVLRMVMRDPNTPPMLAAQLDTLSAWLNRIVTTGVDLNDPLVPTGVELMGQVLAGAGVLPEGMDAFRASMLRRTA
ncbi:hypothetical protein MASR1M101_41500 [Gemmatimonas sp.]